MNARSAILITAAPIARGAATLVLSFACATIALCGPIHDATRKGDEAKVIALLKQNPDKNIILMEGLDLRAVLAQQVDLRRLLKAKIAALNFEAEPYLPVSRLDP